MKSELQIIDDMRKLLQQRLRTVLHDTADTCVTAGLPHEVILKIALASLMFELIRSSVVLGYPEKDFVALCRQAFREMGPRIAKHYADQMKEDNQ